MKLDGPLPEFGDERKILLGERLAAVAELRLSTYVLEEKPHRRSVSASFQRVTLALLTLREGEPISELRAAEVLGVERSGFRKAIFALESYGFVEVINATPKSVSGVRYHGQHYRASIYRINWKAITKSRRINRAPLASPGTNNPEGGRAIPPEKRRRPSREEAARARRSGRASS